MNAPNPVTAFKPTVRRGMPFCDGRNPENGGEPLLQVRPEATIKDLQRQAEFLVTTINHVMTGIVAEEIAPDEGVLALIQLAADAAAAMLYQVGFEK